MRRRYRGSTRPKAKQALQEIWPAETKTPTERALDVFLDTDEPKYPKAPTCLQKDREELLAFYTFPAADWQSLRTTNPIESTFGAIQHGTTRTKGCLTRDGLLHMLLKLWPCAEKTWRRVRECQHLPKVIEDIQFSDELEETTRDSITA